ncbi:MAG TPA: penicillin-binding protein 2 [Spongiibacteraceae bacterium]|nr:penicillin-binding protein 2 [Spongiibacteraceae bacterium]
MAARLTLKDPYKEVRVFGARMLVSAFIVLVLIGVLIYRYFDLQIHQYEKYRTESDRNRVQLQPIAPKRGLIFDRNGVVLADNAPSYSLTITKEVAGKLDQTLELLRTLLPIDDDDVAKFKERLEDRRPYQSVPLRFRLTEEEIAILAINRYRLPGVEVEAEFVRSYPQGPLFAHALGYVGRISEKELKTLDPTNYSGTHYVGKIGVERFYEEQLHGRVGYQNVETNARGRVLRVLERSEPLSGKNIKLYLDAKLQQVAQEALGDNRGAVVAIDPRTGGVLALVSAPDFDSNLFVTGISATAYKELRDSPDMPLFNRALQGAYPPGSTMKPFFALAGLSYGVVTPSTRISDPGWYQLPNDSRFYRDWRKGGHGSVDVKAAIAQSCDVYFYDLAHKLNIDRLHDFTMQFGFGAPTGIDNTHENGGVLPSREWKRKTKKMAWFPGETLSAGIGQGYMSATPLQLALATAAIANRGVRYEPRLVQSVDDQPLPVPATQHINLAPEVWDVVIDGMQEVVHGERGTAKVMGKTLSYHMAGKTGTAQVVGYAQGIKYDASQVAKRRRDHALFIAFAPVENPQIAIAVLVENGEHGASTAAPIARKVIDTYLLGADHQPNAVPTEGGDGDGVLE